MAKAEATVEELVSMIERGKLRLPEMRRPYVWRATRVRDLLDSLYRGYPSGAILVWETDEVVPLQRFAVRQCDNPYQSTRLLLDGQQRLTSLSAVIRDEPVNVRGRRRPIDLLFNLDHPDRLAVVTEVDENGEGDDADDEAVSLADEADASEDEMLVRLNQMAFVVAARKLEQLPNWVSVTEVFKTDSDAPFLKRAGVAGFFAMGAKRAGLETAADTLLNGPAIADGHRGGMTCHRHGRYRWRRGFSGFVRCRTRFSRTSPARPRTPR